MDSKQLHGSHEFGAINFIDLWSLMKMVVKFTWIYQKATEDATSVLLKGARNILLILAINSVNGGTTITGDIVVRMKGRCIRLLGPFVLIL